jgi:hypothetical protein
MMDLTTKQLFDEITSKDINSLTADDVAFLKARRLYLTPAQRLAYQSAEMGLFGQNEETVVLEQVEEPTGLDEVVVEDSDEEPVEDGIKGMKKKKK